MRQLTKRFPKFIFIATGSVLLMFATSCGNTQAGPTSSAASAGSTPAGLTPDSSCAEWNNADLNAHGTYIITQERAGVYGLNRYTGYADEEISRYCGYDPTANLGQITTKVGGVDPQVEAAKVSASAAAKAQADQDREAQHAAFQAREKSTCLAIGGVNLDVTSGEPGTDGCVTGSRYTDNPACSKDDPSPVIRFGADGNLDPGEYQAFKDKYPGCVR